MKKLLVLIAAIPGVFLCGAQGQEISVQFLQNSGATVVTGSAGYVPAANWNPILSSTSSAPLVDNMGTLTSGTLSVNYGTYFTGSNFSDGTGNGALLGGGLNSSNGGSDSITLGAIPYATYDVFVYGVSDNNANNNGSVGNTTIFALTPAGGSTEYFSLQPVTNSSTFIQSTNTYNGTGTPASSGSFTAGANYVEFTGLTASSFTLQFSGVDSTGSPGSFNASLNGLQIVAVPEPSTYLLLGLGVAGFAIFRKRRAAV